jgi:drug/metabolite transporter (DMT)-like permease
MTLWIYLSIAAAGFQTLRFMMQRQLAVGSLTPVGATFARFMFSTPWVLALSCVMIWRNGIAWPKMSATFWYYAMMGGAAQIGATLCVVLLFKRRNFAVGITLKKTETLLTIAFGILILNEFIPALGVWAILVGVGGLILLADPPEFVKGTPIWKRIFNVAAGLGILSGILFALSATTYRAATLSLGLDEVVLRAVITLAMVGCFQVALMTPYLVIWEREPTRDVFRMWRKTAPMGLLSMAGSMCWFIAFTLQSASLVFAVGQIEVIFSALITVYVLKEKITKREVIGMVMVLVSILAVVFLV